MFFRSPPWNQVVYWALHVATGGPDAARHPLLAVGMVPVRGGIVRVGEGYRTLVRPEPGEIIDPASVQAHQLVPGELEQAPALGAVLPEVERRVKEGVLLVHGGAALAFLDRAFRRARLRWSAPRTVDTRNLAERAGAGGDLGLAEARRACALPEYSAADPLTLAVATAELLLALRHRLGARTVKDLR